MLIYKRIENIQLISNQLKAFFELIPFGRFIPDNSYNIKKAIEYEFSIIEKYIQEGGIFYIAIFENEIIGSIGFHFSKWDTDVLFKRTSIIKYFLVKEMGLKIDKEVSSSLLDFFHSWAKDNQIDVAITKMETIYFTPVNILQEKGYRFYECNTFKTLIINSDLKNNLSDVVFRYATKQDKDILTKIALKSTFKKSHFYLDDRFEGEKIDNLYSKWIESALNSDQKVVIIEHENQVAGIFIYAIEDFTKYFNKKVGVWKLAAIDNSFRGKGLGLNLFRAAIKSCIDHHVDYIDTDLVEKNIISQKLHDKFGFQLVYTLYTFHKWF